MTHAAFFTYYRRGGLRVYDSGILIESAGIGEHVSLEGSPACRWKARLRVDISEWNVTIADA
jgi:hypothetical protein